MATVLITSEAQAGFEALPRVIQGRVLTVFARLEDGRRSAAPSRFAASCTAAIEFEAATARHLLRRGG